jgi:molybdopterin-guanine dinucleotide biosynthesis protein MobB
VQIENGKILASGPLHEMLPSLKNCAKSVELGPRCIPQAISFLGDSGTGKTTLIEAIIPILKSRGYKVGVIKHDAHQFNIDHPGKDSYRFTQAGADSMVIASNNQLALVSKTSESIPVEEIIERYFSEFDIVITEGYKSSSLAKILVMRANYSGLERFKQQLQSGKVVAVASDVTPDHAQDTDPAKFVSYFGTSDNHDTYSNQNCADSPIPTIDLNQPALLAHFIEHNFLSNSNSNSNSNKS